MATYTIGIDFGTLSVRTILVRTSDGKEMAQSEFIYPHGVISRELPSGIPLPEDWALQHPADYLEGLKYTVRDAVAQSGVQREEIIAIGIDFTSDTCMPVDEKDVPLCLKPEFERKPHAWVKLWKHHGAEKEAEQIRQIAQEAFPQMLIPYGGQVFSEWMLPKLLSVFKEDAGVLAAATRFLEAGDWMVSLLTGEHNRSLSYAEFKAFHCEKGWPDASFLRALAPGFEKVLPLMQDPLIPPGGCAGRLNAQWADLLNLPQGIAVSAASTDALTPMPALGLTGEGDMLISIGTSSCQIVLGDEFHPFPGVCGVVRDGIMPGKYGYETGQSCVGDLFSWGAKVLLSPEYAQEAGQRGISPQQLLTEKAEALRPGQSGLIALDWWNGVRSPLMNSDLSGMILGLRLSTKPEEIYRALIESTAFSTRLLIEAYCQNGIPIRRIFTCGGISYKNKMLMQIYADVTGYDMAVADSRQTAALGSAVLAAASAGSASGGYDSAEEAAKAMACSASTVYKTNPEHHRIYSKLYEMYKLLYDAFGRNPDFMQKLAAFRQEI